MALRLIDKSRAAKYSHPPTASDEVAEVRVEVEAFPLAAVVRGVAAQAEPGHHVTGLIAALTESGFKH
eukprot:2433267-Pyramimonas_sp.AAC.1